MSLLPCRRIPLCSETNRGRPWIQIYLLEISHHMSQSCLFLWKKLLELEVNAGWSWCIVPRSKQLSVKQWVHRNSPCQGKIRDCFSGNISGEKIYIYIKKKMGGTFTWSSGSFQVLSDTTETYSKKEAGGKNKSSRYISHRFKWWCDRILLYGTVIPCSETIWTDADVSSNKTGWRLRERRQSMWWVRESRSLTIISLLLTGICISLEAGGAPMVFQAEKRNIIPNYPLQWV